MFNWQYMVFGFLFFLVSTHFTDIICTEELNLKESKKGGTKSKFIIRSPSFLYFLSFLFSGVSLFCLNSPIDLVVYMISQIIITILANISICQKISYNTTQFICADVSMLVFIILMS